MFAEALKAVYARPELAGYRDFTHQHAAKNLFDQGDYAGALAQLQAAAALRRQRGNPELIASTKHAIAVTR